MSYLKTGADGVCLNANQSTVLTKSTQECDFGLTTLVVRFYFPATCPSHSLSPKMKATFLVTFEGVIENSSSP